MTRQITSIRTLSNKYELTVYVDFNNGTYGTHTKNKETGKWFDGGLKAEELTEAKKLALVNGKWTNWKAGRNAQKNTSTRAVRCPDCGYYDCGSNCNANRF